MGIGTPDDLDDEAVDMRDGTGQFLPSIAAMREETVERGIAVASALDEVRCAVTVIDISGQNQSAEQVARDVLPVLLPLRRRILGVLSCYPFLDHLAGVIQHLPAAAGHVPLTDLPAKSASCCRWRYAVAPRCSLCAKPRIFGSHRRGS